MSIYNYLVFSWFVCCEDMVKKNKKKEEEKVQNTKVGLKATTEKKKDVEKEKKVSKCICYLNLNWLIVRDSLDSVFQKAKETKEKNKKKKEKEEKREQMRIKKEFEAINEMKTANGGLYLISMWIIYIDPIGYDEESGMKIYREDQLNLGKGGNTPLCPFDCDCCF